ncbi:hypothetical protein EJ076_00395 [Mesorhizobium sp. M7D.F.Ca.US.005.01.1.1]|nr:hypothetical protein EJ076_00395 [Mesorhizobium sp. M7D.F.Ca.US.005.01.1.1]
MSIFRSGRPANSGFLRFRCSRTLSTLRSGSRKPPFSARPDLNLDMPRSMSARWLSASVGSPWLAIR